MITLRQEGATCLRSLYVNSVNHNTDQIGQKIMESWEASLLSKGETGDRPMSSSREYFWVIRDP